MRGNRIRKKGLGLLFTIGILCAMAGCGRGDKELAAGASQEGDIKQDSSTSQELQADTGEDEGVPGWKLDAQDKVSFDWYINFSWYTTPWGENAVSKAIEEETGVHINFISPQGNEAEKFNALISSDTLPDLITLGWWENQVDEMISRDMVYSLNELADQYDMYFWKVVDPTVCSWYEKEDGNLYCYPNSCYTPEDYEKNNNISSNQTFLVRKDIYEAIGSPDMTTTEGFQQAVEDATTAFPEVDGYPLIPVGAHVFSETGCNSFDKYLQNFLAIPYEVDGKAYDRFSDPEYRRWLGMFRELGAAGYLKEDIFIDQRTQMEEKIARGQYFCMLYQRTDMEAQQKVLYANNPDSIYIAVDGPKNSNGADPVLPGTGINGWTITLISKNCERPDRAIEFLSYLISEHGQQMVYLGVEGLTYDMVNGKPLTRPEVKELLNTDRNSYDQLYGADDAYWMLQDNVMQLQWSEGLEPPMGQLEEWTYPYSHYLGQYEVDYDINSEAGNIARKVEKLWSQVLPKLLLASTQEEFDALYDQYLEEAYAEGYDIVLEENTRQYQQAKDKLGMQ